MKKSKIIATMAIMMTMGISSVASAFSDVNTNNWYYKEVKELQSRGVVKGYNDNTFRANGKITNVEALAMVMRAVGKEAKEVPNAKHWSDGIVKAGVEAGVIGEKFNKDALATREEVVEMIIKAAELEDVYPAGMFFSDTENLNVSILYSLGVIKGEEVGGQRYFRPERQISRAEMSVMTLRVIQFREKA